MSLLSIEFSKTLRKNFGLLFLLLALVIKIILLGVEEAHSNPYSYQAQQSYLSLLNRYTGKLDANVRARIAEDYDAHSSAEYNLLKLRHDYSHGRIEPDSYRAEVSRLEKLLQEREVFLSIYSQYVYADEKPNERYILNTAGWERLLSIERSDWAFSLCLILLSAMIYRREHEGEMQSLHISTVKGNRPLAFAKLLNLLVLCVLINLLSFGSEVLFFGLKYGLPHGDYPLQSLYAWQDCTQSISLIELARAIFVLRFVGFLILSLFTVYACLLTQNLIASCSFGLALIALPFAIPLSSQAKSLLPSPYGFLSGIGLAQLSLFPSDSRWATQALPFMGLFWLCFLAIAVFFIINKTTHVRFKVRKELLLLGLLLLPALSSCVVSPRAEDCFSFNFASESIAFTHNGKFISLDPTPLVEDLSSGEVRPLLRNPLLTRKFLNENIVALFLQGDQLYYETLTEEYTSIRGIDLHNGGEQKVYYHKNTAGNGLLSGAGESQRSGRELSPFILFRGELYLLRAQNLLRINLHTGRERTLIEGLAGSNALTFRNGYFYYINKIHQVRRLSLWNAEVIHLAGLYASFSLHIQGDQLFFDNPDDAHSIFTYDLRQGNLRRLSEETGLAFASDEQYFYFINTNDNSRPYRIALQDRQAAALAPIGGGVFILPIIGTEQVFFLATDPKDAKLLPYHIGLSDGSLEFLEAYTNLSREP